MGKASKWFRGLLGLKKSSDPPPATTHADSKPSKEKRRWSFVKSVKEKDHHSTRPAVATTIDNRRRGGSYGDASEPSLSSSSGYVDGVVDPNKHAIAVAAATAAVAEAAVAAAQAAAAVVRLTSSGRCNASTTTTTTTTSTAYVSDNCGGISDDDDEWAAIKIQSAFRGYLARRALRALKGLVKLQALVRGHIVRKKTADTLRRMQVLLRAQARARVGRSLVSESPSSKSSHYHYTGPATPEKFEHALRAKSTRHDQPFMHKRNGSKLNSRSVNEHDKSHLSWNWSDQRMDEGLWDQSGSTISYPIDDERSDKILEIDPGKPHFAPKRRNLFHSSHHHHHHHRALASDQNSHSFTTNSKDSTTHQTVMSTSSCEVQSLGHLKFTHEVEEGSFCTAENSPQFYSASSRGGGSSSRRGPFTPTQSDGSRSYLSGYSDHPNYMSYTESSKAKVRRSLSAPKQRPQFERSVSAKRYSVHGFGDSRSNVQRASSTLHSNFTSKAYPGSGRLDRLGMPVHVHVQGDAVGSATTDGFYNRC